VKARGTSTLNEARRRMLRVADLYDAAEQELHAIARLLERDPNCLMQARACEGTRETDWFEGYGVERWIEGGIEATIEDASITNAAELLRMDAWPGGAEQGLAAWQAEQREEALERARGRRAA
jgi:uncharacterized protein YceH (UPF0502 family)